VDLCAERVNGYYDVVNFGNEGWIVRTPYGKHVHTRLDGWVTSDSIRGDGSADRDMAREYAEKLIAEYK